MFKLISRVALSATIIAGNVATVSANTTNVKTGNGVTVNSVALKSNLVEIEGRTLTDAEAAKVEGEVWWVPVGGAVAGVGYNAWRNVQNGRPWHQNWVQSGAAGAYGATCAGFAIGTKGAALRLPNSGAYWASCGRSAMYLYGRW